MKAVVCTEYGPPEVLQLREIEKPTPKDNEVLIRVHATTVSASDVRIRSFTYAPWFWLPGRIMFGITRPRKTMVLAVVMPSTNVCLKTEWWQ
jgi:NADPH:quinone reductase-like Zn-dependent oxidoreductase